MMLANLKPRLRDEASFENGCATNQDFIAAGTLNPFLSALL